MKKQSSAFTYLSTTGNGIAVGTGICLGGFFRNTDAAGTLTVNISGSVFLTMSADRSITFQTPIAITGPVTITSSGATFTVIYR